MHYFTSAGSADQCIISSKSGGFAIFFRFVDLSDTGVAQWLFNFNDDDYDDYYNDDVDDDDHLLLTIQKPVHTEINRYSVQLNAQIDNNKPW